MFAPIARIVIYAKDAEKLAEFYRRVFELKDVGPSEDGWIELAAGGCNLGYVLATLNGEVVRVLLLFYLAPLWTVLLSRLLLGERLNRFGVFVIALSLAGGDRSLMAVEPLQASR
jgi:drug/metabolite transporter (DMT)-like permease